MLRLPNEILKIVGNELDPSSQYVCRYVCKRIHNVIYKHLFTKNTFMTFAILDDHVNIAKWLLSMTTLKYNHYQCALNSNSFNVLEWMYSMNPEFFRTYDWGLYARRGWLSLLRWVCSKGIMFYGDIAYDAAYSGNLDLLKWIHSIGVKLNYNRVTEGVIDGAFGRQQKPTEPIYIAIIDWLDSLETN